ncbi:hypothetical protein LNA76_05970 [Alcaligenes sp. MMA]|uniref:hypothetical protein n=1 Tax=Alcaligenes sp. MMA TaxID=2893019 RepID=UPI001E2DDFA1|nr:hypothetical protein [Alcaligenes sp. MMA]MCC9162872.1 hypothetical protein [Alcaligenes sp. MMA]
MTVDTQQLLAKHGSIAPLSSPRLQEIRDRAFHRMDDRTTRGEHIHITANEAIELVAAAQALNNTQAKLDAQATEIERLREALQKVRPVIAADRQGLLDCHGINAKIPTEDELGTHGLYEYDGALHVIDAALSGEPT